MEMILRREIIANKALCRLIGVGIFIILTALGAFVRIPLPFTPVPLTLQTFFVLLSGAFLGVNLGLASQLGYVGLGILGLPIFAGAGSGWLYLCGPTAGYLFGFIPAALFVGRFIKYGKENFFSVFIVLALADLVILILGTVWLKLFLGYSIQKTFFIGFLPFIIGDLLKACVATALYLKAKLRLKEIF